MAEPYAYSPPAGGAGLIPPALKEYEERAQELAQLYVKDVAGRARSRNIACRTAVTVSLHPHEDIVRVAEESGCDVIFMAAHGRTSLDSLFIGRQTEKVLTHSTIPVLVFP